MGAVPLRHRGCYDYLSRFRAKDVSYVIRFLAKVSVEFATRFIIQTIIWNHNLGDNMTIRLPDMY